MNENEITSGPNNPVDILLVEDDPDHTELISLALHKANELNHIVICNNAQEALTYLKRQVPADASEPKHRPALILLDISMPGMNGLELLKAIRKEPVWASIPVCMLTTSQDPQDVQNCYAAGANGFVSKPTSFSLFMERIMELSHFWFEVNQPPHSNGQGYEVLT